MTHHQPLHLRGGSVAGSARHEVTVSLEEKRKNELRIFEDLLCREKKKIQKARKDTKITRETDRHSSPGHGPFQCPVVIMHDSGPVRPSGSHSFPW